jgi:integrase
MGSFQDKLRQPFTPSELGRNTLSRRYQTGSLSLEKRKQGPSVWVYRWREEDIDGQRVRRKLQVGTVEEYPTEYAAMAAADPLRLTINTQSGRDKLKTTLDVLWEHYVREELCLKELSTQDSYTQYAKNWIQPRWGDSLLKEIKTVNVERWLRALPLADGSQAKIKCVMSAMFSHGVRWELCDYNPISSGMHVGMGGKRGPSIGVRVSAKRRKDPLVLTPAQVTAGLALLEMRDQLLVFMDGSLGIRRGELGALRWTDCNFETDSFNIRHSYYWRRGGHLKATKSIASARPLPMHPVLKAALLEWKSQSHYNRPEDFLFPSHIHKGKKPVDLAAVLNRKIKPAFASLGISGVGWHTFRHTVGTLLAEMGEHQLTIRDYLRHANLTVTNKYLQATAKSKRHAQDKLVEAILPSGRLSRGGARISVQ